jgi:glycosyltransferase involved in cell wall biosynthesis
MSRFANIMRVIFVEEPVRDCVSPFFSVSQDAENRWLIVPHLPQSMSEIEVQEHQRKFVSKFLEALNIHRVCLWLYSPMALLVSDHLKPELTVYDCMDELSLFKFAPPQLRELEHQLFGQADVVFTGGYSLYAAKKHLHSNIHPFPSSIDYDHFAQARMKRIDPDDQQNIPHPRFGFYGVIDERMDLKYVEAIAEMRPHWQFIFLGPTAKIDENQLPSLPNIHFLGMKNYHQLPEYLSGWDVAIMPFALNDSTRFISPTKTPEYLAAGKPVISTPINDVIRHYGEVVYIAATPESFVRTVEHGLDLSAQWSSKVTELLKQNSWDQTWTGMVELMEATLASKINKQNFRRQEYV